MEVGESEIKTVASYTFQMAVGTYTLAIQKPTALAMPGGIQGLGGAKYELPTVLSLDNTHPLDVPLFFDCLAQLAYDVLKSPRANLFGVSINAKKIMTHEMATI